MNKIVRWASLALACVLLALSAAPALAQTQVAAMTEIELRQECVRWFGDKKYAGDIKNSDHPRYRVGRRITLTTKVNNTLSVASGGPTCTVTVRSEDDGYDIIVRDYEFDGSVAKWTRSKRVSLLLTPRGTCLQYGGTIALYGTVFNAGEALFCP